MKEKIPITPNRSCDARRKRTWMTVTSLAISLVSQGLNAVPFEKAITMNQTASQPEGIMIDFLRYPERTGIRNRIPPLQLDRP